jgi:hypothetical protein
VNIIGNQFWGIGREAVHVTSASTVNILSNIVNGWSQFNAGNAAFSTPARSTAISLTTSARIRGRAPVPV